MKQRFVIGLVLLLALASCTSTTHKARKMARRAERLADTLPDSTLCLIDSVLRMEAYFSERERMELAMLQGDVLFGHHDTAANSIPPLMDDEYFDDKPFLSTSPELERAAAYFARKKQYDRAATAALYSGFVQQHYGENKIAMQSFKDAEQFGDMAGDSLAVALAQCKMGKMLYDDFTYNDALSLLKSSERRLGNRFAEKALVLNMVSVCYLVQGDQQNAEKCLQQSLELSEKSHSDKVKRKVLNNYAVLYRIQGKHEQSIECLRQTVGGHLDDAKVFVAYLNLGRTFMASGNVDSASMYLKQVENLLPTANIKAATKVSAYEALSSFAEVQNNNQVALAYHKNIEDLLSKIMIQRQEQSIYRIQQQYDYENIQNELNRKIILRHRIILFISILLLASAIIILILQVRQKQMREAEIEMKQQLDILKNELSQSKKNYYFDEEIDSRLQMIVIAMRIAKRNNDPRNEWKPLVNAAMNGEKTSFDASLSVMEKAYPGLYAKIRDKYPSLTETESKVFLLSCTNLNNQDMADLLELKIHTINKSRSVLRKKLGLESPGLTEQLRELLSSRMA